MTTNIWYPTKVIVYMVLLCIFGSAVCELDASGKPTKCVVTTHKTPTGQTITHTKCPPRYPGVFKDSKGCSVRTQWHPDGSREIVRSCPPPVVRKPVVAPRPQRSSNVCSNVCKKK